MKASAGRHIEGHFGELLKQDVPGVNGFEC